MVYRNLEVLNDIYTEDWPNRLTSSLHKTATNKQKTTSHLTEFSSTYLTQAKIPDQTPDPPPPYEKLYNENEKLRWAAIFVRETDIDVWANDEEDILNSVNWRCRSDKWYFKLVPHSKRGRKIEYLTPPGPNKRRAGRCYTDYITLLYTDRSRLIWALPSCLLLYVLVGWGRITFSGLSNIKYGNENSTDKI